MVEIGLGLIAACLPTISILFKGLTTGSVVSSFKMRSSRSRVYSTQHSQQRNMSTASHAGLAGKREVAQGGKFYELQEDGRHAGKRYELQEEGRHVGKSYELQERRAGEDV
jgi:hypothetical protein